MNKNSQDVYFEVGHQMGKRNCLIGLRNILPGTKRNSTEFFFTILKQKGATEF